MLIKHSVEFSPKKTFRTSKISSIFDFSLENKIIKKWEFDFKADEKDWKIGLILGSSGSGKTTIAKHIFGDECFSYDYEFIENTPFVDCFSDDLSTDEIIKCLGKVGLSSPPSWVLPYSCLSNGEKFRVDIAKLLLLKKELVVIDEFTSVVDRQVAKITSHCINKYMRSIENKKIVAISCHYDVKEWLRPDWVLDLNNNKFSWECLRRPKIEIKINECDWKCWELFKHHHYLSSNINKSSKCFIASINNIPVAFTSYIHFAHPVVKNMKRAHRTVVLPDYQGIGIGNSISDFIAEKCLNDNLRFVSTTSHPSMINYRIKSKKWKLTKKPNIVKINKTAMKNLYSNSINRYMASFEYVG